MTIKRYFLSEYAEHNLDERRDHSGDTEYVLGSDYDALAAQFDAYSRAMEHICRIIATIPGPCMDIGRILSDPQGAPPNAPILPDWWATGRR